MRESNTINIQEPAVKELHTQRSCFKRSCTNSCGCFIFLLIIVVVLLNVLSGSGSHETKELPAYLPPDIEIYESQRIQTIQVSDIVPTGNLAQKASYIPRFFLSGIYTALGEQTPAAIKNYYSHTPTTTKAGLPKFVYLFNQPITPQTQYVQISWEHLPAKPKFILKLYTSMLSKNGYSITHTKSSNNKTSFDFDKDDIHGSIQLQDTPSSEGTDSVLFYINLPLET